MNIKNSMFSFIGLLVASFTPTVLADSEKIFAPLVNEETNSADPHFSENLNDYLKLIKHSYWLTQDRSYNVVTEDLENDWLQNSILLGSSANMHDIEVRGYCPISYHCKRPTDGARGANWADGALNKVRGAFKKYVVGINTEIERDYPGFIAYKWAKDTDDRNLVVIVMRGTQAGADGLTGADWNTNYSGEKLDITKMLNADKKIRMHRGFAQKYLRLKGALYGHLTQTLYRGAQNFANRNPDMDMKDAIDEFLNNTQFLVTGHSQGGGMAQVVLLDLVRNFAPRLYGPDFQNSISNRFRGYGLSAPRIMADEQSAHFFEEEVGRHNFIRHSSPFDIVSVVGIGKNITKGWFSSFINLAIKFITGASGGFKEVGNLALTPPVTLAKQFVAENQKNGHLMYRDSENNEAMLNKLEKHLRKSYTRYIWSQHAGSIKSLYHGYKSVKDMKNAMAAFGPTDFIGFNHYGTYQCTKVVDESGDVTKAFQALFNHEVVGTEINHMLSIGEVHNALKHDSTLNEQEREKMIETFMKG